MGKEKAGNLTLNPDGSMNIVTTDGSFTIIDPPEPSNIIEWTNDPYDYLLDGNSSSNFTLRNRQEKYAFIDENSLKDATKEELIEFIKKVACREDLSISVDINNPNNKELIEDFGKLLKVDKATVKNPKEIFELKKRGIKVK
jgi:hypothetical protein